MASNPLPADTILISASPGETRFALVANGQTLEFAIDRGHAARGDLILGRVTALNRALNTAFVEIGELEAGFLKRAGAVSEGDALAVEVINPARREKGASLRRAAEEIAPDGNRSPPHPIRRSSVLARLLEESPDIRRVLVDDSSQLGAIRSLFPAAELHRGSPLFETCDAAELWVEVQSPVVTLPGGASLIIEETEAATLIDVDGGTLPAQEANLAATPEILRQVRLRGLAGHLLIDPIPMKKAADLSSILAILKEHSRLDPTPTRLIGRTPLGMIEMIRERRRPSLGDILLERVASRPNSETLMIEAIRALLVESAAQPAARLALVAGPHLKAMLENRPDLIAETERRLGRKLVLIERTGLSSAYEVIEESQ